MSRKPNRHEEPRQRDLLDELLAESGEPDHPRGSDAAAVASAAADEYDKIAANEYSESARDATSSQATTTTALEIAPYAATAGARGILKKANEAVVMTPVSGDLAFLSRKLFNVLLYHAQQQGLKDRDRYSIPLKLLKKDAKFNSNDLETIKARARSLISTTIEWGWTGGVDEPGAPKQLWSITALMADLVIEKDDSSRELTVNWSYSSVLKKQLLESREYTKLSLAIMANLRSLPALALYEIAARYETNPSGLSRKVPWERWVGILKGKPITAYPTLDYRRFKAETLKTARAQVNAEQVDFELDWKEYKVGRKVTHLQLVLRNRKTGEGARGPDMELRSQMDIDLFNRMLTMGIGQYAADGIYGSCDERVLREAIEKTEARIANKKLGKVVSPEAYLKERVRTFSEHLEDGITPVASAAPAVHQASREAQPAQMQATIGQSMEERLALVRDDYVSFHITKARGMFAEAMSPQQEEWMARFGAERLPTAGEKLRQAFTDKGLKSPMVAGVFYKWLSEVTWNPKPSNEELVLFGFNRGTLVQVKPGS